MTLIDPELVFAMLDLSYINVTDVVKPRDFYFVYFRDYPIHCYSVVLKDVRTEACENWLNTQHGQQTLSVCITRLNYLNCTVH